MRHAYIRLKARSATNQSHMRVCVVFPCEPLPLLCASLQTKTGPGVWLCVRASGVCHTHRALSPPLCFRHMPGLQLQWHAHLCTGHTEDEGRACDGMGASAMGWEPEQL